MSDLSKIEFFEERITDQLLRENFEKIRNFLNNGLFLTNGLKLLEVTVKNPTTDLVVFHTLGIKPKDILVTYVSKGTATPNFEKTTDKKISLNVSESLPDQSNNWEFSIMKTWTWAEMKAKVKRDLDLEDEDFITNTELLGYVNEAIDVAEQIFKKKWEKYFETEAYIPLVAGEDTYELPDDIYAYKITLLQYTNGSEIYPVKRLKELREIPYIKSNDCYQFRIVNSSGVGPRLKLYPASRETSTQNLLMHFLRNAAEILEDTDTLDMPEAGQFIIQYIKDKCANKEKGPMYEAPESPQLVMQKNLMIEALQDMIPDTDNEIKADLSFYYEFDNLNYGGN